MLFLAGRLEIACESLNETLSRTGPGSKFPVKVRMSPFFGQARLDIAC
jgi:hypothetical protein